MQLRTLDPAEQTQELTGNWWHPPTPAWDTRSRPAVVLGDREKLSAEGATLALFQGFSYALDECQRLIVVGYSFGDAHVNRLVQNWLAADNSRQLTVVDPFWPNFTNHYEHGESRWTNYRATFERDLMQRWSRYSTNPDVPQAAPRMNVYRLSATDGLPLAISRTPHDDDSDLGSLTAMWNWTNEAECVVEVTISYPVAGLYEITVSASEAEPVSPAGQVGRTLNSEIVAHDDLLEGRPFEVRVYCPEWMRQIELADFIVVVSARTTTAPVTASIAVKIRNGPCRVSAEFVK